MRVRGVVRAHSAQSALSSSALALGDVALRSAALRSALPLWGLSCSVTRESDPKNARRGLLFTELSVQLTCGGFTGKVFAKDNRQCRETNSHTCLDAVNRVIAHDTREDGDGTLTQF